MTQPSTKRSPSGPMPSMRPGRVDGDDLRDWFDAERALSDERLGMASLGPQECSRAQMTRHMLRLGIAVNATRAAQQFFHVCRDLPGPAGEHATDSGRFSWLSVSSMRLSTRSCARTTRR
jgi:hypothetical protein